MLVLGSLCSSSMLDTPFPDFSVVVPPSESRRMISTCRSHIRVFRILLLYLFKKMSHAMKAKNDGVILHYWLLPSDQWMQRYASFATLSYVDWNRRFFQNKFALLEFLAPVRVKSNSGWLNTWSILALSMLDTSFPAFSVVVPPSESRRMISTCRSQIRVFRILLLYFF